MHYVVIVAVIAVILFLQAKTFKDTLRRVNLFKKIFPDDITQLYQINGEGMISEFRSVSEIDLEIKSINDCLDSSSVLNSTEAVSQLRDRRMQLYNERKEAQEREGQRNPVLEKIRSSINRYLNKNKGSVSDFHLIKDIVDRNCDAEEEAIQTQVPIPLYYGLMGTMAGIIIGVGYLWLSGGLSAILSTNGNTEIATKGIVALLGGVALAMICSIAGIVLTTLGSTKMKDAKIAVEQNKHEFLSWMQAELLPKLNNDLADVLTKVTSNLTKFNQTFSDNARQLHDALSEVNQATAGQAQLLAAIDKLKISKIASANIDVYDKLKACTDEIGMISEQLQSSRAYLEEVRKLNEKLDSGEQRTRAIEDMATFFVQERGNMEAMRSVMNQAVGGVETSLRDTIESLKEASAKHMTELVAHTTEQGQRLRAAIDEQDKVLQQKVSEINWLVTNLSSVDKMVQNLDASAKQQTQAIRTLSQDIRDLATQKASGTITVKQERMPRWAKVLIIVGGSIVVVYCLFNLIIGPSVW